MDSVALLVLVLVICRHTYLPLKWSESAFFILPLKKVCILDVAREPNSLSGQSFAHVLSSKCVQRTPLSNTFLKN